MRSGRQISARREDGFTYIGLVVLLAIIGLVGAATLKVDALLRRTAAEEELLETGAAFSEALRTYAEATPRGQPTQPPSLQELLKDTRSPALRRHLRKIFVDPMTGKAEWGVVWVNPDSHTGVLAVYSLSDAKPFKVANFDARFANFENKAHISEWKFAATGQAVAQGQVQPGQPGQPPATAPGQPQPSLFPNVPGTATPATGAQAPASLFPERPSDAPGVPPPPAAEAPPAAAPAPAEAPPADKPEEGDKGTQEASPDNASDDATPPANGRR